jgi:fluoride exporter
MKGVGQAMNVYLAVMLGGLTGALLRWNAGLLFGSVPWTTLGINWLGCLALGFWLTYAIPQNAPAEKKGWRLPEYVRAGIGTGVCGGFTTFSTFSVEGWHLVSDGRWLAFAAYVGLSLIGGVALAAMGVTWAKRRAERQVTVR